MKNITLAAILLAALLQIIGFAVWANWWLALILLAISGVWLAGLWRGWQFTSWIGVIGLGAGIVVSGSGATPAWFSLLMLLALLVAWDLDGFTRRLALAGDSAGTDLLIRAHLRRLLLVAGIGLLAGGLPLVIQTPIGFGWMALLALLALVGISRAVQAIRESA